MRNRISKRSLTYERELTSHLEPDEELLWSGGPKTGIVLKKSDIGLNLFAFLWIVFFSYLVLVLDVITTVAFLPIGIYLLIFRYPMDSKRRSLTCYGLTDKRIIIVYGFFRRKIKSIPLDSVVKLKVSEYRDGFGTVVLNPGNLLPGNRPSMSYYSNIPETDLEYLADFEEVQTKIVAARDRYIADLRLKHDKS